MMPAGRPSKYDPSYCEIVVELGKQGKSVAQMCAHFDISRQTIENWAEQHAEFLEAFTRAKVHMQAKLEEIGFDGLHSKDFNAPAWKTTMQARFRDEYTERRELNHSGQIVQIAKDAADL
jgi:transposase-like protein